MTLAGNSLYQYPIPILIFLAGAVKTHQRMPALQIPTRKWFPILIDQIEIPSNLRPPDTLGSLGHALTLHALLLVFEVPYEPRAREHEEQACLPREGPRPVSTKRLLYRLRLITSLLEGSSVGFTLLLGVRERCCGSSRGGCRSGGGCREKAAALLCPRAGLQKRS